MSDTSVAPPVRERAGGPDLAAGPVDLDPYDAVVLVGFGGPERPEDVVPFLENVTRGRGIPRERLAEVGQHYFGFGGRSPINEQCRLLLDALRGELARRGSTMPLYWGNRNWEPYLGDTLRQVRDDGHRRILAVITSAYPSYSSCRQYRENLYDATVGLDLQVDRLRHYANHPSFVAASVEATLDAVDRLGPVGDRARLLFVTHSIPTAMAATSGPPPRSAQGGYVDWHLSVAAAVAAEVADRRGQPYAHELVYCSRSGPPTQPWLEPDVNDRITELHAEGVGAVVAVPIGFISDHMEVIYDLDTEAAATAGELGVPFARAATAGVAEVFVAGLVDLMAERAAAARGEDPERVVVAGGVPGWYECQPDCCANLRDPEHPTRCQVTVAS